MYLSVAQSSISSKMLKYLCDLCVFRFIDTKCNSSQCTWYQPINLSVYVWCCRVLTISLLCYYLLWSRKNRYFGYWMYLSPKNCQVRTRLSKIQSLICKCCFCAIVLVWFVYRLLRIRNERLKDRTGRSRRTFVVWEITNSLCMKSLLTLVMFENSYDISRGVII